MKPSFNGGGNNVGSSYPIKVSQLLNKKSGIRIATKTNGCLGLMIKSNYHG